MPLRAEALSSSPPLEPTPEPSSSPAPRVAPRAGAADSVQPATSPPLWSQPGPTSSSLSDDRAFLGADGVFRGDTGLRPYSRSYAPVRDGVLRSPHGSPPPASAFLTEAERKQLASQPPGEALDRAAGAQGERTHFAELARSRAFHDPSAEFWEGKCHAWAWAALDGWVNRKVDVEGPQGERGLWIKGQWLSRADLGNWMMAVGDGISVRDPNELFDGEVTAEDLLNAAAQYLVADQSGFVADIHLDAAHGGAREVWNQPFFGAEVETKTLEGEAGKAVLEKAREDGHPGASARLVRVRARYGNEVANEHEGPPGVQTRNWNLYAVTDERGQVLKAYTADDPRLDGVRGLPTRTSAELPEYLWRPSHRPLAAAREHRADATVAADPHRAEFRFFVGTVLEKGVSGATRKAFEQELSALPPGRLGEAERRRLEARYPGIANAYSDEQWQRHLAPRGLAASDFSRAAARP